MTAVTNPMRPYLGRLAGVEDLATGIKLFQIELTEPEGQAAFAGYRPGQFAFVSVFGAGEAPFGVASIPAQGPLLEFAVKGLGHVTHTLHALEAGDPVGVRGPLGNWFPMDEIKERNVVVLGGGIGGAPLRPVIHTILDNRADYGHLTILWAARSPDLLVFTDEYDDWRAAPDTELHLTVVPPAATSSCATGKRSRRASLSSTAWEAGTRTIIPTARKSAACTL